MKAKNHHFTTTAVQASKKLVASLSSSINEPGKSYQLEKDLKIPTSEGLQIKSSPRSAECTVNKHHSPRTSKQLFSPPFLNMNNQEY